MEMSGGIGFGAGPTAGIAAGSRSIVHASHAA
jgi:hypothetical protein